MSDIGWLEDDSSAHLPPEAVRRASARVIIAGEISLPFNGWSIWPVELALIEKAQVSRPHGWESGNAGLDPSKLQHLGE